jgi:hypothetical protein
LAVVVLTLGATSTSFGALVEALATAVVCASFFALAALTVLSLVRATAEVLLVLLLVLALGLVLAPAACDAGSSQIGPKTIARDRIAPHTTWIHLCCVIRQLPPRRLPVINCPPSLLGDAGVRCRLRGRDLNGEAPSRAK